jgi:geranylgeranyl diphosphate synthase type I
MQAAHPLPPANFSVAVRTANAATTPCTDAETLARFERALEQAVACALAPAGPSPLAEQVRWHFGIGCEGAARHGKRLRPRLLMQVAFDEGATFEQALDAALAVELLHNYSLVHDDIEDGDELRHGRQTVWARFGTAHGINAGDSMCAVSYLTLLRNSSGAPPERVAAMTRVLHAANLVMCAGQAYDIGFEAAAAVSMDDYFAMIEGKTAALFGAAFALGSLAAGTDETRAGAYGDLGRAYGRAFQIRDDLLGTWGSREETGKACGADIAHRKWSFPIVWALSGPPTRARDAIASRYARATPLGAHDVAAVAAALDALGARHATEDAWFAAACEAERIADRHRLDRNASVRALFPTGTGSAAKAAR